MNPSCLFWRKLDRVSFIVFRIIILSVCSVFPRHSRVCLRNSEHECISQCWISSFRTPRAGGDYQYRCCLRNPDDDRRTTDDDARRTTDGGRRTPKRRTTTTDARWSRRRTDDGRQTKYTSTQEAPETQVVQVHVLTTNTNKMQDAIEFENTPMDIHGQRECNMLIIER